MKLGMRTVTGAVFTVGVLLGAVLAGGAAGIAAAAPAAGATTDPSVVWICHPGQTPDPCETPLDTTVVPTDGSQTVVTPARPPEAQRPVDCFYVYPTVTPSSSNTSPGTLEGQAGDPAVQATVEWQATRFSSVCRVFAPAYRQVEVGTWGANWSAQTAYSDVLAAWQNYLANDNDGRGVILIGHSQGSLMLRELLRDEIGTHADQLDRLVGAFLLGGNVAVRQGQTTGVDDGAVPLCTQPGQYGCVVAYSTYDTDPGYGFSIFGNSGTDVLSGNFSDLPHGYNMFTGVTYEVACTDPGTLSGLSGPFGITIPSAPFPPGGMANNIAATEGDADIPDVATTWVDAFQYTGSCQTINGANVFRYNPVGSSPAPVEVVPFMGTHIMDLNLGVEKLTTIASRQVDGWLSAHS